MRTVSARGGHGPILLGKSEAEGGQLRQPRDVYLQGVFLHREEIILLQISIQLHLFTKIGDYLHGRCKKSRREV